jgi:hypothetical protein
MKTRTSRLPAVEVAEGDLEEEGMVWRRQQAAHQQQVSTETGRHLITGYKADPSEGATASVQAQHTPPAPLSAAEARMFRTIQGIIRGDKRLFGELGANDQFVGLEATVRDWISSKRFKSATGMNINEHRLGLLSVVCQTLNNHVCATEEYGKLPSRLCCTKKIHSH